MAGIKDLLTKNKEVPAENSEEFKGLFTHEKLNKGLGGLHNSLYINNLTTAKKVIKQNGGIQCLYDLYDENETIKSDIDTRIEAVTGSMLKINTDNEKVEEIIRESLEPCMFDLIRGIWWSVAYGYSVVELVWDEERYQENGDFVLSNVFNRKPHEFTPLYDLKSCINTAENLSEKKIAPFGKYLLTCNAGTPDEPTGDPLLARLWWLHLYRCKGMTYWIKALERFGYPFLHGKTQAECVEDLNELLDQAREGSAITTDMGTEIDVISANVNTKQFSEFEDNIRQRIHHAILGQNLTSEVTSGSMAAAKVHNSVRIDKLKSDIRLIENSLNYLVKMILVLNGIPEMEASVELELNNGLNKERAERDKILIDSGAIKLTEQYFKTNYDFKDGDFEINQQIAPIAQFKGLLNSKGSCGHTLAAANLTKEVQQIEDVVEFLADQDQGGFEAQALLDSILASNNKKELVEQLSALSSNPDISFEELLADAYYFAMSRGAEDSK